MMGSPPRYISPSSGLSNPAIILLVTPQFLLITVQINEFAEKGSYGIACAFATILILITYGSVLLMNLVMKYFGTSRKIKEDN